MGVDVYSPDWETKLAWMRARHVVRATWTETGALMSAETLPVPPEVSEDDTTKRITADERERRSREERRRVAQAASGGPLRRVAG